MERRRRTLGVTLVTLKRPALGRQAAWEESARARARVCVDESSEITGRVMRACNMCRATIEELHIPPPPFFIIIGRVLLLLVLAGV